MQGVLAQRSHVGLEEIDFVAVARERQRRGETRHPSAHNRHTHSTSPKQRSAGA
jgi:hypothetical protein